jgi:hypothetical protein
MTCNHMEFGSRAVPADELRRLHTENKIYCSTFDHMSHENSDQLLMKIETIVQQRDELLDTLKEITDRLQVWVESCPPYDEALNDWNMLKKARIAITKATKHVA